MSPSILWLNEPPWRRDASAERERCRCVKFTRPINPITRSPLPSSLRHRQTGRQTGEEWIRHKSSLWHPRMEKKKSWKDPFVSALSDRSATRWTLELSPIPLLTRPDDDDDFSEINDSIDTLNFHQKLRNWTKRIWLEAGRQAGSQASRRNWTDN